MANQLIDLKVTKIAFVDAGDNPEANIVVSKRKPDGDGGDNTPNEKDTGILKRLYLAIAKLSGFSEEQAEQLFSKDSKKKAKTAAGAGDGSEGEDDDDTKLPDENDDGEGGDGGGDGGEVGKKKKKTEIGGYTDMARIDKSKLTPEELAQLEAIEKKALVDDDDDNGGDNGGDNDDVNKNKGNGNEDGDGGDNGAEGDEDIYKGLHPAVAAEIKRLRKRADEADERDIMAVAKKYEIIGKKPEELCETLKSLKAAGGTAYNDMLAVLDSAVEAVEKGGVFDEFGKRGGDGGFDESDKAWQQIENHAKEIIKAKPQLTWDQALDEAAQQHPDLVHAYEDNL